MKEEDYRELGMKAQGHIIKFRETIKKLLKIDDRQTIKKRLKNRLRLEVHKKEVKDNQFIRWDSTVIDENSDEFEDSYDGDGLRNLKTTSSQCKSMMTISSQSSSIKRKLGSIEVPTDRSLKRTSADLIIERKSSNCCSTSADNNNDDMKRVRKSSFNFPISQSQISSSSWMIYDSNKPKLKRAMSFVEEEDAESFTSSLNFDRDMNVRERKSSSKYVSLT